MYVGGNKLALLAFLVVNVHSASDIYCKVHRDRVSWVIQLKAISDGSSVVALSMLAGHVPCLQKFKQEQAFLE